MEWLSIRAQLWLWVAGIHWHNPFRYRDEINPKHRGECTPDFSCCETSMRTPFNRRLRFALFGQYEKH